MCQNLSAREFTEKLVSSPTVGRDSNLALIDWVEYYLTRYGVVSTGVYDTTSNKAARYTIVGPVVADGTAHATTYDNAQHAKSYGTVAGQFQLRLISQPSED